MFTRSSLPRFGGAFFCLLLTLSSYAGPYKNTIRGERSSTTVTVVWLEPEAVDAFCSHLMGLPASGHILACYNTATGTIFTPEPASFEDHYRLMLLGHEFWHALGAEHPDADAAK